MDVEARIATSDDLATMVELIAAHRLEQRDARGGVLWDEREAPEPGPQYVGAAIGSPSHLAVVGTIDGVVLACAIATTEVLRDEATIGRVELLYVDPHAREVGVGEAVISVVIGWCRDRNCVGIDAHALPGERLTKNFFESHGFVARLLTMHHRFDDPS